MARKDKVEVMDDPVPLDPPPDYDDNFAPPPLKPSLPPLGQAGDIHDRLAAIETHIRALWELHK